MPAHEIGLRVVHRHHHHEAFSQYDQFFTQENVEKAISELTQWKIRLGVSDQPSDMLFYDLDGIREIFKKLAQRFPTHQHLLAVLQSKIAETPVAVGPSEFASFISMRQEARMHAAVAEHVEEYLRKNPDLKLTRETVQEQAEMIEALQAQLSEVTEKNKSMSNLTDQVVYACKRLGFSWDDIAKAKKIVIWAPEELEFKSPEVTTQGNKSGKETEAPEPEEEKVEVFEEKEPPYRVVHVPVPTADWKTCFGFMAGGIALTYLAQLIIPIIRL